VPEFPIIRLLYIAMQTVVGDQIRFPQLGLHFKEELEKVPVIELGKDPCLAHGGSAIIVLPREDVFGFCLKALGRLVYRSPSP
jgi:hypothetical protein